MNVKNVSIYKIVACLTALFIFAFSMNYYSPDVNASNTTCQYYIYEPTGGEHIYSYTLEAVSNYTPTTRVAIGSDDRVTDNTKTGVVKLIDTSNENYVASGFVIDDHIIATAAHCLYDKGEDPYGREPIITIDNILLFNSSGSVALTIESEDIIEYHIPVNYINAKIDTVDPMGERFNYDYALIYVEENLSDYVQFELGAMLDNFNTTISVTGYPVEVNGETVNNLTDHKKFTCNGQVTTIYDSTFKINADTSDGNSGGPAYVTTQYNGNTYFTVIGILVSGDKEAAYNLCNKLTTDQLHFYKNNPYV